MPELYVNCHIDTDSASGSEITKWRSSGQFTVDIGGRGFRMALEMGTRFSNPATAGTIDPFMAKNIDRAAALGLKILCLVDPLVLRSAAWDALGGDWDGYVPQAQNWRLNRVPNHPAVMAKIIERIAVTVAYGLQVLGADRFSVQVGNEARHVTRSGGDPSYLTATISSSGKLVVSDANAAFVPGWLAVETPTRTYVWLASGSGVKGGGITTYDVFTTEAATTPADLRSVSVGTTVRQLDRYVNDGDIDVAYLDQLSQIIVALKATFPTLKVYGQSFWQLGGADATGIKTHLDFFADHYIAGDLALQPGWAMLDGWTFNIYAYSLNFAKARGSGSVDLLAGLIRDNALQGVNYFKTPTAGKEAAWTALGWATKPLLITEFGWSRTTLDMKSQNIDTGSPTLPPSEFFRGQVTRRTIEMMEALGGNVQAVMLFHARTDQATGSVGDDDYAFVDLPGAPTKALQAMARTRSVGSVIPSGYASAGGSYLGATGVSAF